MARAWIVSVDGRQGHDGGWTGGDFGPWARVWASRPGVVEAQVVRAEGKTIPGTPTWSERRVEVEVRLAPDFDPARDYLLVEHRDSSQGRRCAREEFELLAGVMPAWAAFPAAWARWVQAHWREAGEWLLRRARSASQREAVEYALRKSAKGRIWAAWEDVARAFGLEPPKGGSWTAVCAMPIRIARRLGWRPPEPPPRWEDPAAAQRVLVASPSHLPQRAF